MKKYVLTALILLLLPVAEATVTISGVSKDAYNVGDKIGVSGYVSVTSKTFGFLSIDLDCQQDMKLFVKLINLKSNEREDFEQELPLPFYIEGPCRIKSSLIVNNTISEEASSKEFVISRELKGTFELDKNEVQLGETVTLKGDIFRLDGNGIDGFATIYFIKNDTNYVVDSLEVKQGEFSYSRNTKDQPGGKYNIIVDVFDNQGNQKNFTIDNLTLIDELKISVELNALHVAPGKEVSFSGVAKNILNEDVGEGEVIWELNGNSYASPIKNGKFSEKIEIPKNFKTGDYIMTFSAVDSFGNAANASSKFTVDAVPTSLVAGVDKQEYNPEEQITVTAGVYDQANDIVSGEIGIEILNTGGAKVYSGVVESGGNLKVNLDKYAVPGSWRVRSFTSGLEDKKTFNVNEIKKLDFALNGSTLYVKNIGNVLYNEPFMVKLSDFGGNNVNVVRNVNLGVDEQTSFNLGVGIPTGAYSVQIGNLVYDDVQIQGVRERTYEWVYYILVAMAVFTMIYLVMAKSSGLYKKRKFGRPSDDDYYKPVEPDEGMKERIRRDMERNMIRKEPERRADTTPTVPKKDFRVGSYSGETIFGNKRRERRGKDGRLPI